VLAREQLLSHVWGYDYDPGSNIIDVYVGYLRKKLGQAADRERPRDGLSPGGLEVVYGRGGRRRVRC
jgi:Transcriptional regulatory protein, C terminal